jgi:hypothetical protein
MEPLVFQTTVESSAGGPIEVPFDIRGIFGRAKPAVLVTINEYAYRSTVAVYAGRYYVPLSRANAAAARVERGVQVTVTIEPDQASRDVAVPADLASALDAAGVRDRRDALSYTHRREHVEAIEEARRPQTRARRITRAVEMMG